MKFYELSPEQVKTAITKLNSLDLIIEREVFIPEADVFLCKYKGERFNIKFDIAYGTEVEAVSDVSPSLLHTIEQLILDAIQRTDASES